MSGPPEPDAARTASFTAHRLRFECVVRTPVALNVHKGSALRGALFHALRGDEGRDNGFCVNKREQFCHRCPYHAMCPISSLLATVDESSERGIDVPRPYTIEPPPGAQTRYEPGERLQFGLTLFARALDLFPYVIVAVRDLERGGIGIARELPPGSGVWRRGTFSVERIVATNPLTGEEQPVLQIGDDLVAVPDVPIRHGDVAAAAEAIATNGSIALEFVTPTRLVDQGRLLRRPLFLPLALRLFERLEALSGRYGGAALPIDRAALLPLAERVEVVDDRTRWVELDSYSTRTRSRAPIGGFVGRVAFAGELRPFLPWLLWGQFTHVGKDAVKGNGLYRVAGPDTGP